MAFGRRYSWSNNKYDNCRYVIQDPPKPREYQELCSITTDKDNYALSENTISSNIISKGFFQSEAQKALQNSQIKKAFEIAEQYIETSKRKFYRFFDTDTKKIIISKQLNRFDAAYVLSAKKKLKGLQRIGSGHDIMHITLTISHAENSDYIEKYRLLKNKFNDFLCFLKRVLKKKIDYVSTYEVTTADDGRYHQHIHLILIGIGYLPKKIIYLLSAKWKKITGVNIFTLSIILKIRI